MEIAFKDINGIFVDFKPSTSFILNAKKHAPPSSESCLYLTDLCFTAEERKKGRISFTRHWQSRCLQVSDCKQTLWKQQL